MVTLDFECLKWGILISMSCKLSTPLWIEISSNRKNVVHSQLFLWFPQLVKMHKMPKCTGLLESSGGMRMMKYAAGHLPIVSKLLALWEVASPMMVYIMKPYQHFLNNKVLCVISWKPPSWKIKLKDDTSIHVDEAASFLRKQLAKNADKCWGDGGKGFTHDPKCMLIKSL